jgi:hypothetical protein
MKGGVEVKTDVYVPTFLMDYDIPDEVWDVAITTFNKLLSNRPSVTCQIKGMEVDILRVEVVQNAKPLLEMGAVMVYMIAKPHDVKDLLDIHFVISGFVTYEDETKKKVDGIVIENITYGGDDSKRFKILQ